MLAISHVKSLWIIVADVTTNLLHDNNPEVLAVLFLTCVLGAEGAIPRHLFQEMIWYRSAVISQLSETDSIYEDIDIKQVKFPTSITDDDHLISGTTQDKTSAHGDGSGINV